MEEQGRRRCKAVERRMDSDVEMIPQAEEEEEEDHDSTYSRQGEKERRGGHSEERRATCDSLKV